MKYEINLVEIDSTSILVWLISWQKFGLWRTALLFVGLNVAYVIPQLIEIYKQEEKARLERMNAVLRECGLTPDEEE